MDWLNAPAVAALLGAARQQGVTLLFVGGAVRNGLLGRPVTDIDLATPSPPQDVMERFAAAGMKVIPTGLAHGTVTVLAEGMPFEITTLRRDVETDGRHAKVAFTDDWQQDAARRDFTMNALYLSPEGERFDYFGGTADALAGRVRFIGEAEQRIQEDALRILRFFRFHAEYGQVDLDATGLEACRKNITMLDTLSGERIQTEMIKLLRADDPLPSLQAMDDIGAWQRIAPPMDLPRLGKLLSVEKTSGVKPCTKLRMAMLLKDGADLSFLRTRWKCANEFVETVHALRAAPPLAASDSATIKRAVRKDGARMAERRLLQNLAESGDGEIEPYRAALALVRAWQPPAFPVNGEDLKARGIAEGKALGEALKALEGTWEASDYTLSKQELLGTLV